MPVASVVATWMKPPVDASKKLRLTDARGAPVAALVTRPLIPPAPEERRTLMFGVVAFALTTTGVAVAALLAPSK